MKLRLIIGMLGRLLIAFSLFMLLPLFYAVAYSEFSQVAFLVTVIMACLTGLSMIKIGVNDGHIGIREGYLVVSGTWILTSCFGGLPFLLSGTVPTFLDALFETVSGLTTTGASVIQDLEVLPNSILLWRSMTHWLGGMGIIVLFIVFLSNLGAGALNLFKAEVPGPKVERVLPRIRETAIALWLIYVALTVAEIIMLVLAGMSLFDAVNHAFATVATGGFSTKNTSIKYYDNLTIELILAFFMFVAGGNFGLYLLVWKRGFIKLFQDTEFRVYSFIVAAATCSITLSLSWQTQSSFGQSLRDALFTVISIITTTGFATADFDQWPAVAKIILLLLMFIGGCAGSTAGGIKVVRFLIMIKDSIATLLRSVHPQLVRTIKIDHKPVDFDVISNTMQFFFLYITIFVVSVLLVAATGIGPLDAMGAVAATLGNIGPGFGVVGPTSTYFELSPLAKTILTLDMLLGRLEIFTILVLFHPEFWQPYLTHRRIK